MDSLKINKINVFRYSLPLARPLYVRGHELLKREGLIVQIKTNREAEGYGEIAPLPFLTKETLEDVIEQAQEIKQKLKGQVIPEGVEQLDGRLSERLGSEEYSPSVAFGLEAAVLTAVAQSKRALFQEMVAHSDHNEIRIIGLLQGKREDILRQAKDMVEEGFSALKLKVGSNIDEEIKTVQMLSQAVGERALLRLDANQSWNMADAVKFGHEVGLAAIDYIEEPFKNIKESAEFFMKTTIPIAADESFDQLEISGIKGIEGVETLVLKPMVFGGVEKTWNLLQEAKKNALDVVLSSSYESMIGLFFLAQLAGCSLRNNFAGLDTAKFFKDNLLNEKNFINHGKIDISQNQIRLENINFDLLEEVK